MKWFNILEARLRALLRRESVLRDIEDELRIHVELETETNIQRGMPPDEARVAALNSVGNLGRNAELGYGIRGGGWLETLWQDLRYGARMLLKNPGFTLIAVITLALGIGANTAIFSVINGVLLKPLPYPGQERLVAVWEVRHDGRRGSVSYPNFVDWRAQNSAFERIAIYRDTAMALTGGGEPSDLHAVVTTPDLFPLLSARPELGRVFLPEEEKAGSRVVVLGHGAWRKYFGADPNIVGKGIKLDGRAFTVVGVMPAGFNFPVEAEPADLWVSAAISSERDDPKDESMNEQRGFHVYEAIARLKPGVTLSAARTDLETVMGRLRAQYPDEVGGDHTAMRPYLTELVGEVERALLVLFAAVGVVLLIACANVASLLLARALGRQREIAVRAALGASWGRIVRQLLTESLLLSAIGGIAGLLLGAWGVGLLKSLSPADMPRIQDVHLDIPVLSFTLLVSLLTGLAFGLIPALRAARADLNEALKEGGRGGEGLNRNRLRSALVVTEVASAMTLLVGAGLLINSFARLQRVNLGFDPHQVLTLRVELPEARYREGRQIIGFNKEFLRRIETLPGVRSAAMVFKLPLGESNASSHFEVEGQPLDKSRRLLAGLHTSTPGYFQTLGVRLVAGRDFGERDEEKSKPVVIINQALAERYFPNQNPIGKHIRPGIAVGPGEPPWREIVGVVGTMRYGGPGKEPGPEFFLPQTQMPFITPSTVVRVAGDPLAIVEAVRNEVRALDSDLPVDRVKTLDQYLTESVAQPRFNTLLLALFAGVAMILTAVGLYGVMAYSVTARTREIGVRVALGARGQDVLRLVIKQGMKLTLIGVAIGLVSALALTRLMAGLLFDVTPTDPATYTLIALLLGGVALLACYIPARRAARVDPVTALRVE